VKTRSSFRLAIVGAVVAIAMFGGSTARAYDIIDAPLVCGATVKASTVLTTDLGPCASHGLVVGKAGITIDLNGHTITGKGEAPQAGILNEGFSSVTVRNGKLKAFGEGIRFSSAPASRIAKLTVTKSGPNGITLSQSPASFIEESAVHDSTNSGIRLIASDGSVVQLNDVSGNGLHGIEATSDGMLIANNTVVENGFTGIYADGTTNKVKTNVVKNNAINGIVLYGSDYVAKGNTANKNGDYGIMSFSPDATVSSNTANWNGLSVDDGEGLGIYADKLTAGGGNVASNNDDPKQCVPQALCA
jgi:parallel beta-helix repeat protein